MYTYGLFHDSKCESLFVNDRICLSVIVHYTTKTLLPYPFIAFL